MNPNTTDDTGGKTGKVIIPCPICTGPCAPDWRYCPYCGAKLHN